MLDTSWQRWLRQPQSFRLRKLVFHVHLITSLTLGLYIVVLSVTGSVLVFRDSLMDAFETPVPAYEAGRAHLSRAELTAAAAAAYPGFEVTRVGERFTRRRPVIEIWVEKDGSRRERLFNPYTGEDLGDALPRGVRTVLWLARLHNELLFGASGKRVNGVGSATVALIAATGLFVWWPGVRRWKQALWPRRGMQWRRFTWDLHSALGFWFFGLILLWGLSGVYLAFPEPFSALVDATSDPDAILGDRPGDIALRWLVRLHFGRWEEVPLLSAAWAAMGMVPVVMFVTGAIMFWNRKIRKRPGSPHAGVA